MTFHPTFQPFSNLFAGGWKVYLPDFKGRIGNFPTFPTKSRFLHTHAHARVILLITLERLESRKEALGFARFFSSNPLGNFPTPTLEMDIL